jgi:hypothetical protein
MNEAYLKRTYGITLREYEAIGDFQDWKCYICRKPLRYAPKGRVGLRVETDHDHKVKDRRKSVRGLLCGGRHYGCNRRLGRVDNGFWLDNASQYLKNPPAQLVLRSLDDNKK